MTAHRPRLHRDPPPDGVTREMVREAIRQVGHDMTHPPTSPPPRRMSAFEKAAAIERDQQWGDQTPGGEPWSDQRKADALFMAGYDRRGLLNELGWRRDRSLREYDPDPLRPPEPEPPSVAELAHWAATGRPPRRYLVEPLPDDLASAWRSCLVRAALLALALILVGLAAVLVGRAS